VEYEDGSSEGDLDPGRFLEEFQSFRDEVRRAAGKYAAIARTGLDEVMAALDGEQPETLSAEKALAQVKANLLALPDPAALAERLDRLAR
jgi:hypothetical protein